MFNILFFKDFINYALRICVYRNPTLQEILQEVFLLGNSLKLNYTLGEVGSETKFLLYTLSIRLQVEFENLMLSNIIILHS